MKQKLLREYEKALTWSEAHVWAKELVNAIKSQDLIQSRIAKDEISMRIEKLVAHRVAVEIAKNQ